MDTSSQAVIATPGTAQEPAALKRQRWTVEQKRQIVEETLAVGTSVARVARAHRVNANQVFYSSDSGCPGLFNLRLPPQLPLAHCAQGLISFVAAWLDYHHQRQALEALQARR